MEDNNQKAVTHPRYTRCRGIFENQDKKDDQVGKQNEPTAEKSQLGWTITSPGKDRDVTR